MWLGQRDGCGVGLDGRDGGLDTRGRNAIQGGHLGQTSVSDGGLAHTCVGRLDTGCDGWLEGYDGRLNSREGDVVEGDRLRAALVPLCITPCSVRGVSWRRKLANEGRLPWRPELFPHLHELPVGVPIRHGSAAAACGSGGRGLGGTSVKSCLHLPHHLEYGVVSCPFDNVGQ